MGVFIVDLVLGLLGLLSVITWSILFWKLVQKRRLQKQDQRFLNDFWSVQSWVDAEKVAANDHGDFARIARLGFKEISRLKAKEFSFKDSGQIRLVLERQFRQSMQNIQRQNEKGLTELATIGSASPFIGLFGTVWGIKNALTEIGKSGQAGLDVVAGPIGEALIATAIGIAVALPAVLSYNYFLRQLNLRITELENFSEDFLRYAEQELS